MDHVELARMGGKARAKKMNPAQRSASARKAADARWDKARRLAKRTRRKRVA